MQLRGGKNLGKCGKIFFFVLFFELTQSNYCKWGEKRQEDCHVTTDFQGPRAQENKKGLPISQIRTGEEDATFYSLLFPFCLSIRVRVRAIPVLEEARMRGEGVAWI